MKIYSSVQVTLWVCSQQGKPLIGRASYRSVRRMIIRLLRYSTFSTVPTSIILMLLCSVQTSMGITLPYKAALVFARSVDGLGVTRRCVRVCVSLSNRVG